MNLLDAPTFFWTMIADFSAVLHRFGRWMRFHTRPFSTEGSAEKEGLFVFFPLLSQLPLPVPFVVAGEKVADLARSSSLQEV